MPKPKKASDIINLKLRLREDLRARLEYAAADHGYSMNTEIIRRLEESFRYRAQQETSQQLFRHLVAVMKYQEEHGKMPSQEWTEREILGEGK